MARFKFLFVLLALVCLIGIGGAAIALRPATTQTAADFNCCDDPSCFPGCCPECPPDCCSETQQVKAEPVTCPLTGEQLPCPNCCPLNQNSTQASAK
jgi:hypothetical protein